MDMLKLVRFNYRYGDDDQVKEGYTLCVNLHEMFVLQDLYGFKIEKWELIAEHGRTKLKSIFVSQVLKESLRRFVDIVTNH